MNINKNYKASLKTICTFFVLMVGFDLNAAPFNQPLEIYLQKTRVIAYENKLSLLQASLDLINEYKLNIDEQRLHDARKKEIIKFNNSPSRINGNYYIPIEDKKLNNSYRKVKIKFAQNRFKMAQKLLNIGVQSLDTQVKLDLPFNDVKFERDIYGNPSLLEFFDATIDKAEMLTKESPDTLFMMYKIANER